jgi:hypothetical protein
VVDNRNTAVLLLPTQEVFEGLDSTGCCDCLGSSRYDEHEALGGFFKVRSVGGVIFFYALWTCVGSVDCLRLRTVPGKGSSATNKPGLPARVSPRSCPAG